MVDKCRFIEKDLPSSGSMIVEINDELATSPRGTGTYIRIQNGALTTQHETEKRRESFLIWPIVDGNFSFQIGKNFSFL